MPLDPTFLRAAKCAMSPAMGTESMAPLLYALVRFVRPCAILEIGAGYTTLFLLKALADNLADHEREIAEIERCAADPRRGRRALDARLPLVRLEHYRDPYRPKLYCVDDFTHPQTSARQALARVKALGLSRLLSFRKLTSVAFARTLRRKPIAFDLMWLDAGGEALYAHYLRDLFPYIRPDGGLVMIHSTETNLEGQALVKKLKLQVAASASRDLELVGLLEPHKIRQNSFLLLRSTRGMPTRVYSAGP